MAPPRSPLPSLRTSPANAAISARLPYLMATSRFAHFLKVMGRDWVGRFMEASDVEYRMNRWINNYVNANEAGGQEMKARFPPSTTDPLFRFAESHAARAVSSAWHCRRSSAP